MCQKQFVAHMVCIILKGYFSMNDLIFLVEGGVPLLDSDSEETKRKIAGGGRV